MRHELPQLLSLVCFPLGLFPALLLLSWRVTRASSAPPCAALDVPVGQDVGRKQEGSGVWALLTNALQSGAGTWLCILNFSRAAALCLNLSHGWGGLQKPKGDLCPVAEPNPVQVMWSLSPSPHSSLSPPCPGVPLIAPNPSL